MINLTDFTGRTIIPGDMVITISTGYKQLCYGTVVKICKKKIGIHQQGYSDDYVMFKYPKEVVVRTHELELL